MNPGHGENHEETPRIVGTRIYNHVEMEAHLQFTEPDT